MAGADDEALWPARAWSWGCETAVLADNGAMAKLAVIHSEYPAGRRLEVGVREIAGVCSHGDRADVVGQREVRESSPHVSPREAWLEPEPRWTARAGRPRRVDPPAGARLVAGRLAFRAPAATPKSRFFRHARSAYESQGSWRGLHRRRKESPMSSLGAHLITNHSRSPRHDGVKSC